MNEQDAPATGLPVDALDATGQTVSPDTAPSGESMPTVDGLGSPLPSGESMPAMDGLGSPLPAGESMPAMDGLGSPLPFGEPAPVPDVTLLGVPLPEPVAQAVDMLADGGPVVMILLGMSVVAVAIVLLKLWQFRSARLGQTRVARDALALYTAGHAGKAIAVAGRCRSPVAQALARAIRGQSRGLPEAKVREEVLRTGAEALHTLRSWFRALEVIGSLAPLLGLFGTVLGMIEAFRQLEAAGNQVNPAILSGGIWEALLTTAVGLAVAIPVVAVLNWMERRIDQVAHDMDTIVTRVFTEDLSHDAPGESARPSQEPKHDGSRRLAALGA